jgi:hypothetical protein
MREQEMLTNIIDRRKHPYKFKIVNAVIEPTRHDNRVKGADKAEPKPRLDKSWIGYDEKEHVAVRTAILWAVLHHDYVTLYLYDKDSGIRPDGRSKKSARAR